MPGRVRTASRADVRSPVPPFGRASAPLAGRADATAAQASNAGASAPARKKSRPWTDDETLQLIDLRKELDYRFTSRRHNHAGLWNEIAAQITSRQDTGAQCEDRFHNVFTRVKVKATFPRLGPWGGA